MLSLILKFSAYIFFLTLSIFFILLQISKIFEIILDILWPTYIQLNIFVIYYCFIILNSVGKIFGAASSIVSHLSIFDNGDPL